MSAFDGATLLITGGTGSFGNTVLKHFLTSDIGQILTPGCNNHFLPDKLNQF